MLRQLTLNLESGSHYDIHLLPGETTRIMNKSFYFFYNDIGYFNDDPEIPENIAISYNGLFKGAPNAHGITINQDTGEIKIATTLPTPRLYNFIFQVIVSDDEGNSLYLDMMRVHIHQSIKQIWLTPSTLTLYPSSSVNTRFSVYAEFDDKVIGDITDQYKVLIAGTHKIKYISSNAGRVAVDEITGVLSSSTSNISANITVTYGASPAPDHLKYTGTVNTVMPLSHPRKITRINPVGRVDFDKKANVLIIPDGFDDKYKFNKIIGEIIKGTQTEPYVFPFNKLKDDINYWRIDDADFLQSTEKGSTVLGEWFQKFKGVYWMITASQKPHDSSDFLNSHNLTYVVGLPVEENNSYSFEQQKEIWKQLYNHFDENKIDEEIWMDWLKFSSRKIVNERDTPLGLVVDGKTQNIYANYNTIRFNAERRISWDQFKVLIENLQYEGQTVGTTWITGKDKGGVCLLCRNDNGSPANAQDYFTVTLNIKGQILIKPASGNKPGFDLVPRSLTNSLSQLRPLEPIVVSVFAHEWAHSFDLGDEYGTVIDDLTSPGSHDFTWGDLNLMPVTHELIVGDPARFDPSVIRWNWYRMKAVGILKKELEQPDLTDNKYEVFLEAGHASYFKTGDIVRIRKRKLTETFLFSDARFEITNIPTPNPMDKIEIIKISDEDFDILDFPGGSLLVKTIPGKSSSATTIGDDLKMIAPIIHAHLEKGIIPLNVEPPTEEFPYEPCISRPDRRAVMVPLNLPDGLPVKMKNKEIHIVGLYEGGRQYYCGVYHPAGICMMRSPASEKQALRYCQVCSFVLVDKINPLMHKMLDDAYDLIYPEP